ncbi:MAG TPA: MerR family transcriptional regulator [Ktedonobacteraceae bacterium]|nr:MerR family transcriptional regulator [Ktedonobacteraceae bacterium]
MREHTYLKIGEFARVGHVSIATLRHYDQCGLLKPNALDTDTGYRYYSLDQLARLNRILALKDLGFPLQQIVRLLEEDLSLVQLRAMFTLKQAQAQHMIDIEQARLAHISARLRQIEQEGTMPVYEVLLKQVDPVLVASIRSLIQMGDDLGQQYRTIIAYLDQQQVQHSHPAMLLLQSRYEWHDDRMAIEVETAVPLSADLPGNEQIATRTLPGCLMASTIHIGDDLSIGQAYAALYRWVKDNRYLVIDPPRQLRLQRSEHMDPGQYVTEVQFPVKLQAMSGAAIPSY